MVSSVFLLLRDDMRISMLPLAALLCQLARTNDFGSLIHSAVRQWD